MHKIAAFILKSIGWKLKGKQPNETKYIIAVAPHTSNKDFIIGRLIATKMRVNVHFLVKKELFFFPYGLFLKLLKAIPVNRKAPKQMIENVVTQIKKSEKFVLVVTPEGTRSKVKKWKKGYYYMAKKSGIPILPAAIDFEMKEVVLGELISPSDNEDLDFKKLISFYKSVNPKPKYPENFMYPE
jgi:1-acyl-sn-glycerol-3-phosphate acyltransferase